MSSRSREAGQRAHRDQRRRPSIAASAVDEAARAARFSREAGDLAREARERLQRSKERAAAADVRLAEFRAQTTVRTVRAPRPADGD